MSMPRKGSRIITVDGKVYRWKVNGEDYEPVIRIESQSAGASLSAVFPPHNSITPASIKALIDEAVGQGWDPDGPKEHRGSP